MTALTFSQTIDAMFQLGILVALWGVYSEMRKLVCKNKD